MPELTPRDFEKMLDSEGNINTEEVSEDAKTLLALANLIKHSRGVSMGIRCIHCQGSKFWPIGSQQPCVFCKGQGWK